MKQSYIIQEVQDIDSQRGGVTFYGTLHAAKMKAALGQVRADNILKICDAAGRLVIYKQAGKWVAA